MPKLPSLRPKQIEKALIKSGFTPSKGKGSHVKFKHPDGRFTVVPGHNRPVRLGTLRAILRQSGLSLKEFLKLI